MVLGRLKTGHGQHSDHAAAYPDRHGPPQGAYCAGDKAKVVKNLSASSPTYRE